MLEPGAHACLHAVHPDAVQAPSTKPSFDRRCTRPAGWPSGRSERGRAREARRTWSRGPGGRQSDCGEGSLCRGCQAAPALRRPPARIRARGLHVKVPMTSSFLTENASQNHFTHLTAICNLWLLTFENLLFSLFQNLLKIHTEFQNAIILGRPGFPSVSV